MVRGVIVYLTQSRHSSYQGRNSQWQLQQSVRLLYANYNNAQHDDVIFFHTGDITSEQQEAVLRFCTAGTARFQVLTPHHFYTPRDVQKTVNKWHYRRRFSTGYRHMIRFFTIGLWDVIAALGYEYVMRLDEDSYIWSPIRYNIFEFMHTHRLLYTYRLASWERGHAQGPIDAFHELVRGYAQRHDLDLHWLLGPCRVNETTFNRSSFFSTSHCGDMYTIYNNFFATHLSFWRRAEVWEFLQFANRSGTIYTDRFGDALWHSAALAMFMPSRQLQMLQDFAYEHSTLVPLKNTTPGHYKGRACRLHDGRVIHREDRDQRPHYPCPNERFDEQDPPVCLQYGGIALASSPAESQPAAINRMADLSLALLRCPQLDRLYQGACIQAPLRRVIGLFANRVTLEQIDCEREPRPFFCKNTPYNTSAFSRVDDELTALHNKNEQEILRRKASNASKAALKSARHSLRHNLDHVFVGRQSRHVCSNWCKMSTVPSLREKACYRRANRFFVLIAEDARQPLLVSPPAPPPVDMQAVMRSTKAKKAYYRWIEERSLAHESANSERYMFADSLNAPMSRPL